MSFIYFRWTLPWMLIDLWSISYKVRWNLCRENLILATAFLINSFFSILITSLRPRWYGIDMTIYYKTIEPIVWASVSEIRLATMMAIENQIIINWFYPTSDTNYDMRVHVNVNWTVLIKKLLDHLQKSYYDARRNYKWNSLKIVYSYWLQIGFIVIHYHFAHLLP